MSRRATLPLGLVAAALACVLGAAGLIRGVMPAPADATPADDAAASVPADALRQGDIAVYAAYVREPANPQTAAAYLTVSNLGDHTDRLLTVTTGAAESASLHDIPTPGQTAAPATGASVGMTPSGPVEIRPGQTLTLEPGKGHVMLEGLIGALLPGQHVSLLLQFETAGRMLVNAPVIAIGAPAPAGSEEE